MPPKNSKKIKIDGKKNINDGVTLDLDQLNQRVEELKDAVNTIKLYTNKYIHTIDKTNLISIKKELKIWCSYLYNIIDTYHLIKLGIIMRPSLSREIAPINQITAPPTGDFFWHYDSICFPDGNAANTNIFWKFSIEALNFQRFDVRNKINAYLFLLNYLLIIIMFYRKEKKIKYHVLTKQIIDEHEAYIESLQSTLTSLVSELKTIVENNWYLGANKLILSWQMEDNNYHIWLQISHKVGKSQMAESYPFNDSRRENISKLIEETQMIKERYSSILPKVATVITTTNVASSSNKVTNNKVAAVITTTNVASSSKVTNNKVAAVITTTNVASSSNNKVTNNKVAAVITTTNVASSNNVNKISSSATSISNSSNKSSSSIKKDGGYYSHLKMNKIIADNNDNNNSDNNVATSVTANNISSSATLIVSYDNNNNSDNNNDEITNNDNENDDSIFDIFNQLSPPQQQSAAVLLNHEEQHNNNDHLKSNTNSNDDDDDDDDENNNGKDDVAMDLVINTTITTNDATALETTSNQEFLKEQLKKTPFELFHHNNNNSTKTSSNINVPIWDNPNSTLKYFSQHDTYAQINIKMATEMYDQVVTESKEIFSNFSKREQLIKEFVTLNLLRFPIGTVNEFVESTFKNMGKYYYYYFVV